MSPALRSDPLTAVVRMLVGRRDVECFAEVPDVPRDVFDERSRRLCRLDGAVSVSDLSTLCVLSLTRSLFSQAPRAALCRLRDDGAVWPPSSRPRAHRLGVLEHSISSIVVHAPRSAFCTVSSAWTLRSRATSVRVINLWISFTDARHGETVQTL